MALTARDIEEELRQMMMGTGDQPDLALDLGAEKARLAELGAGMTEGMGEDLPRGTKVNFAPELEVKAPESAAQRMPIVPKVVDLTEQPKDDMELAMARAEDRAARKREAFERGSRELVGGLTRTQAAPTFKQPQDAEAKLLGMRERKAQDAQRNESNRLAGAKFNFDTREAARKAAMDEKRDARDFTFRQTEADENQELRKQGIEASNANAAAMRSLAGANYAIRRDEATAKQTERDDKRAAGSVPVLGGTLEMAPGLGDGERNKAREVAGLWNAADASVENFQSVLEAFARNPNPETKGRVTAALRTASAAFNSAIGGGAMSMDEARAMSEAMGGDVLSPTGLAALAEKFMGDDAAAAATISNRVRAARQANRATALGRLKAYGNFTEGARPDAPQAGKTIVRNPKTGERRYLNADGSLGEVVP